MPSAACPNRQELMDYAVGKLPDESSDSVAKHLESCPDCRADLTTLPDAEDTLVSQLRRPAVAEPYLAEPGCHEAIARAKAVWDAGAMADQTADGSAAAFPRQLGEYQLIERLGSGGMGAVYKALHNRLDRVVALKVLPRGRAEDAKAVGRFEREMKAIGRLDDPHIVRAYDAREIDGQLVLAMEFVEGLDLGRIVRRLGRLAAADACELARQTALALQVACEHGLVHRDIKPSNLMLTPQGQLKLLDLGLARFHAEPAAEEEMTGTGQAIGTADYMAPEQASDSHTVDIRADVYGLGATLYKLLSGRAPFGGPDYHGSLDKMLAHLQEPIPPIRQFLPEIPDKLWAVLDRMLAKSPEERYSTPAAVAESARAVLLRRQSDSLAPASNGGGRRERGPPGRIRRPRGPGCPVGNCPKAAAAFGLAELEADRGARGPFAPGRRARPCPGNNDPHQERWAGNYDQCARGDAHASQRRRSGESPLAGRDGHTGAAEARAAERQGKPRRLAETQDRGRRRPACRTEGTADERVSNGDSRA